MSMLVNPIVNIKETKRLEICVVVGIQANHVGYPHRSWGVLPFLAYLLMIGIEKKNSSR